MNELSPRADFKTYRWAKYIRTIQRHTNDSRHKDYSKMYVRSQTNDMIQRHVYSVKTYV
jgi:hypothetical protein